MQERLVTRLSGPDKGWKPAFLNPDKGAGGKQPDLWLIDGELPTSTGAASSLIKSSPLEKGCSRAQISPEEKTSITRKKRTRAFSIDEENKKSVILKHRIKKESTKATALGNLSV